ncbi:MAG TPA: YdhR family protein [Candidatus Thermoplasmatota archaeon]|nr:YdhR family protein [Candidatus Thermoplasmatota archaeon]
MTAHNPTIVTVRFRVTFSRRELEESFMPDAPAIAELPGMRWKIWAFEESIREFQSVYLFENPASADRFARGDIIEGLRKDPNLSDVQVSTHAVLESLSRVTRAPVAR